ncbi:NAD(P)-dependent oxidoreductase [Frankia sp. Cppng1_Ct_nod]|uniref:NAD-dependent epimerase/dehydratase family protein n=1 Tax=Frankia sp. Cppng1_Ct_nod TaxID=2897162 RepID=UPI001040F3AF|nr:NAD(P)-dependent oxidoreductase [Frankia sp. Cppng1_Ct_nod]
MNEVYVVGGHGYVGSRVVTEAGRGGVVVVSWAGDSRRGVPSLAWQEFLDHVESSGPCSVVWLLDGVKHAEPQRLDELLAVASPEAHVVSVSTCTVYGARHDDLCGENEPVQLLTTHARLKAGCEQTLITSGRSWCVLRLGALYGIDDRGVRKDRIEKWVTQAAGHGTVAVPEPAHWRGWLHRDQAARALWRAASHRVTGLFNVASANLTFGQAARSAADLFGVSVESDGNPDPCSFQINATAARTCGLLDELAGEDLASATASFVADNKLR